MGALAGTLASSAIGLGGSLIGGLFGNKQDKEAKNLKLQAMRDQSGVAQTMMGSYNDLTGQGESAWNTASPIYKNLLSEYTKATANPYYYAAPEIEATTADTAKQVQNVYQTLGRGPAQQYAAAQAKLGLGNTAQTAVRNARNWGYSGQSSLADVYNQRSQNLAGLAQGTIGNAGSLYSNLANTQWNQKQSAWPSTLSSIGSLTGSLLTDWPKKKVTNPYIT